MFMLFVDRPLGGTFYSGEYMVLVNAYGSTAKPFSKNNIAKGMLGTV
jgi:hypothetical protein